MVEQSTQFDARSIRRLAKNILKRISGVNEVEREVRRLRAELAPKSRPAGQYDLVRLDNISLFMPMYDNLYEHYVSDQCKGFTLERHRELELTEVAFSADELQSDVTKLLPLYLDVLFTHDISVHFLDIGAWVGDVAIRLAKFAKLQGRGKFYAECFDPSFAGTLIPFNTELNGVSDQVAFRPVGISTTGGPLVFAQIPGHSDSSKLASIANDGQRTETYLIHTRTLSECLPQDRDAHVMVKIDVEGIDAKLVSQNRDKLRDATLMIEYSPSQDQYLDIDPAAFLTSLMETHILFDVYYLPRPTRATRITDAGVFKLEVLARPHRYTDVLAVPRTLSASEAIVDAFSRLKPIEPSNLMA